MTNKSMLLIATVLMLVSINNTQAQTVDPNIANDTPDSRYTVHGNGTVTDTITGLIWQQCSMGQTGSECSVGSATIHTWDTALQLADADNAAGYSDWRLPNKAELQSLVAYDRYNPSINTVVFPNTASANYWSSSPYAVYGSISWVVGFYDGYDGNYNRDYNYHVRLVRSGQ